MPLRDSPRKPDLDWARIWYHVPVDVWAQVKIFHAVCQAHNGRLKLVDTASALLVYALKHKEEVMDVLMHEGEPEHVRE